MGTLVRLYVGWRIVRLMRPLIGLVAIGAVMLALHGGHAGVKEAASSPLTRGAVAAQRDLSPALAHAFARSHR